jgi:membrane associated rhomboid family serine protease
VGLSSRAAPRSQSSLAGFRVVIAMAALLWIVEVADTIVHHRLDRYGIEPRDPDGLIGILLAPLLHASFGHLIANTVPFVVMGFAIALRGAVRVVAVTAIVMLVSGLGTWLVGPSGTIHIGASGVVFGYATYLLTHGFFDRDLLAIGIGLVIGAIWGTALLGGLVPQEGISWQGHLFGAVGGVLAARALSPARRRAPAPQAR